MACIVKFHRVVGAAVKLLILALLVAVMFGSDGAHKLVKASEEGVCGCFWFANKDSALGSCSPRGKQYSFGKMEPSLDRQVYSSCID